MSAGAIGLDVEIVAGRLEHCGVPMRWIGTNVQWTAPPDSGGREVNAAQFRCQGCDTLVTIIEETPS